MSIKLTLDKGFEDMIADLNLSAKEVDRVATACINQNAQIMQSELKSAMSKSGVPGHLISEMPQFEVKAEGNVYEASVGYSKGAYDPRNPSTGYKVVFLNYGTPNRTKHGKVPEKGFIARAKRSAKPKMKKANEAALKKILGRID